MGNERRKNKGKTYALYRVLMILSFLLAVFGAYVMLIGYGIPIPNITAQIPGAAVSGDNLPPGALLFIVGSALAIGFGMLSNDRVDKYGSRNKR